MSADDRAARRRNRLAQLDDSDEGRPLGSEPGQGAPPEASTPLGQRTVDMFRERLGLPETAGADEILAAVEILAARRAAAVHGVTIDVPAAKNGVAIIDRAEYEDLQRLQPAAIAARAAQQRAEQAIATAVRRGAIAPADRAKWLRSMTSIPGEVPVEYEQALAAIPNQAAVPLEPYGHDLGVEAAGFHGSPEAVRASPEYTGWKV